PYGVKYWELGVETRLFSAAGFNGWNDYGKKFAIRSRAMKAIDPTIKTGAVGCDSPLEETFKFKPWTENVRTVVEANGGAIDFWQLHAYPPGASLLMRGVDLQSNGAYVEVKHNFQATDTYTFTMYATGSWPNAFPPGGGSAAIRVSVDGVPVEWPAGSGQQNLSMSLRSTSSSTTLAANTRAWTMPLTQGVHAIRFEKVSGTCQTDIFGQTTCATAEIHPFIFYQRAGDGFQKHFDLKDDPMVHYLAQSGAIGLGEQFRLHDKFVPAGEPEIPVYLTEFNMGIEEPNAVETTLRTPGSDLREGMGLWTLFQKAVEKGLEVAIVHHFFDDNWFGMVEGVAYDRQFGDRGRSDPRRRPTFHAFKILRRHLKPVQVQSAATTPSVSIVKGGGYKLGYGGAFTNSVPMVEAIVTKTADGRELHISLMNRDMENAQTVSFDIAGFGPIEPRGTLDLLWSPEIGANNEPEAGVCSHPELGCPEMVKIETYALDGVGASFSYRMPRHSIAAIVLRRSDVDWTPPAQVSDAVAGLFGGFVKLGWSPTEDADLAGYNIYRSTIPWGPYDYRVAQVSAGARAWTDPAASAGN
ncbi:MAG: hypothetical protein K8I02_06010, partial [Candidatus Methylomirabilis sp.]|nr:hypothetical protein [Deltaproteobacteria bacterium]